MPLGKKQRPRKVTGNNAEISSSGTTNILPVSTELSEEDEIEMLRQRAIEEAPEVGTQLKSSESLTFESMPISRKTLAGLQSAKMTHPTDIQAAAIPHALAGRDILGAAKTGSGKTLSFVIPILEKLYTERWGLDDGLAAIIVTPTRELALQIFEVLRTVGRKHQFSAGLVTGGKKEFQGEQERIVRMNILVATPGRLLQHFEQTPGFDASQLLVLVLDEADRILDMGFRRQLDGILEYLPIGRVTMLFSATQTKSVKDLARLSLKQPEYLAVHAEEEHTTPKQLIQNYIICKLPEKLDVLFSFLRSHLKSKLIVFFSTCSQVRYVYELFRGMQPGIVLTALHGKIKQERRTMIYMDFLKRKEVCMFATDIAARGLDFPDVDWVVQVDAPEDSAMYIHRVGRTARYTASGRALLMLIPGEDRLVVEELKQAGVPISKLTVNPNHKVSVANRAASLLVAQPEWKALAKKAFTGYLKSIQLLPRRQLELHTLPTDEFAKALGLPFTPPLPIVSSQGEEGRDAVRGAKNVNRALDKLKKQIKEAKEAKRREREAQLGIVPGESAVVDKKQKEKKINQADDEDEDDEDFLQVKQVHNAELLDDADEESGSVLIERRVSKTQLKHMKITREGKAKAAVLAGARKVTYDDDGNEVMERFRSLGELEGGSDEEEDHNGVRAAVEKHAGKLRSVIDATRSEDVQRERERVRSLHKEQRMKRKAPRNGDGEEGVQLAYVEEEQRDSDSGRSSDDSSDSDSSDSSDSEAKPVLKKGLKRQRQTKDDTDSGSEQDIDDIKAQEALVLKLMS